MAAVTAALTFLAAALVSFAGGWLVRRIGDPRRSRRAASSRPVASHADADLRRRRHAAGPLPRLLFGGGVATPAAPVLATVAALFAIGWYDDLAADVGAGEDGQLAGGRGVLRARR